MMISEIFRSDFEVFTIDSRYAFEGQEEIGKYPGIYREGTRNLYQTMRNLYSLSNHRDIKDFISKIEMQRSDENIEFENAVESINSKIYSPIAKVICYSQLFEYLVPKPDNVD